MSTALVFNDYGGPETQELIDRDIPLPGPLGLEASGVVTAVGEGVEEFAVGDEVLGLVAPGHGGIASYTVLTAGQIELEPGQSLLLLGAAGGVGLMAAQIGKVHQFTVLGVAGIVDLIVDLVGGQPLRDMAPLAKNPRNVISTVDPAAVRELGGAGIQRTPEALEKITDVIKYGLVDPHVRARLSLADAQKAVAAVESGHLAGKVVVEP
ncbi:zinc-binding dehydrogenase [Arthrobacter rhombi]|uniref:zinc-binding dehydrogenase n=1 Tax=Arthrobacter rhombi TaxID=71253 RepID=UPI003FD00EC9